MNVREAKMNKEGERIAILPGSYDPITIGHVDLARRTSLLFDRVVIAVMQNKEKEYLFSKEMRLALAEASVKNIPNASVLLDEGLLVDLYDRLSACCVVKGIRNETDYEYELKQEEWNRAHLSGFETVYLTADEDLSDVSSTEVRRRILEGLDLSELLAPEAIGILSALKEELQK